MPVAIRKFYSEEEFLALERISKVKNEYYRGEIFAMSGASYQHNQITSNLIRDIGQHLKDNKCKIFGSDLRVHIQLKSFYTYPDAVIICGEPSFLDNEFDALYRSEQRMGAVFGIFTFLSIFVACLGLFGLSVYTAERRTKEIGVRKVLGASVQSVVALLSKDFLRLVLLSAVVAFPVAWIAMNKWLEDFAYRITIGWSVFFVAAIAAILIALFTISFQAIKAAVANPVESLRTE